PLPPPISPPLPYTTLFRSSHLLRRHVLALPPKGVADPVDEIEIAPLVLPHQVARAHPGVASLEHVAQDLRLRRPWGRVALEATAHARRVLDNLPDRLTHFVRPTAHAEARRVPHRRLLFDVAAHQRHRHPMREKPRDPPDRARLALDIEQRHGPFGRG